jgi:hypothetical protein
MFGFDAIGRYALAQIPHSPYQTMQGAAGAYIVTGVAISFSDGELAQSGVYAVSGAAAATALRFVAAASSYGLTGVAASFGPRLQPAAGSYAVSGSPIALDPTETLQAGSYAVTGRAPSFGVALDMSPASAAAIVTRFGDVGLLAIPQRVPILASSGGAGQFAVQGFSLTTSDVWPVSSGSYASTLTPINQYTLTRTGDDYEFKLGGVGHLLLEIEEAKRLAAITRKVPSPVNTFTRPSFAAIMAQPNAALPALPSPSALQAQQQQAAAQAAAVARRRRQEAEILLLVA